MSETKNSTLVVDCDPSSVGYSKMIVDGKLYGLRTAIITAESAMKFSNKSNVREVNPKAPVVKKIVATGLYKPEMMPIKNMGLTVSSRSVNHKGNKLIMTMRDTDGILNGGHSQYSFGQVGKHGGDLKKMKVRLSIIEGEDLTPKDITAISTALNDSSAPKASTLLNHSGLAEYMKAALKPEYVQKIEWTENEMIGVPRMTLDEFVMLLNYLDIRTYGGYGDKTYHQISKSAKTTVNRLYSESISYEYMKPIMNDVIHLYELIQTSLTHMVNAGGRSHIADIELLCEGQKKAKRMRFTKNGEEAQITEKYTLFTGKPYIYTVNKGYIGVIMAAFRANLVEDDTGCHWVYGDIDKLFKAVEKDIWSTILENSIPYKESKNGIVDISAATKPSNAVWRAAYNVVEIAVLKMPK